MDTKEIIRELVTAVAYIVIGVLLALNPDMSATLICSGIGICALQEPGGREVGCGLCATRTVEQMIDGYGPENQADTCSAEHAEAIVQKFSIFSPIEHQHG